MKRIPNLLAAVFFCLSASVAAAQPIELDDALGRRVRIAKPVERVVVNFNFEEFTAVAGTEGWTKVVGMSRAPWEGWRPAIFNRYKAVIPSLADMPDIGNSDDGNLSVEKIIGLRPDVFLVSDWTFGSLKENVGKIEAAGIAVVVIDYNAQLLERHLASTRALGKVMGAEARAEELARLYETKYRDVMERVARGRGATKPKVYVELGQAGAETVGNSYMGTMWGKIFDLMGADNIANGRIATGWGPLNAEAVIAADPDAIFIAGSSWVNRPKAVKTGYEASEELTRQTLAPYAARPGYAGLKAVRNGNFNAIEHGLCRTLFDFVAMQFIGKRLYPAAFADIDPHAEFRTYHEKYLPVSYSGNWMAVLKP